MAYVLGLDLGPTSIGWAAIELDKDGKPAGILQLKDSSDKCPAIGSRIFPAGVEKLGQGDNEAPKNKKRREKRSVRRRMRRARARRLGLIALLKSHGLINGTSVEELQEKDPYELRNKAISEKIGLEEFARVLMHFAKRRGFKSNRRQPEGDDAKATDMKKAKARLETELEGKTLGQFWHAKLDANSHEAIRNKRGSYQWVAQRDQYQHELGVIWQEQCKHYPDVLTHEFYQKLEKLLFEQLPFELTKNKKKKVIGMCSLITWKLRCGYSERIAQKFRILQKVNDLRLETGKEPQRLTSQEREKFLEILSTCKDKDYAAIRKRIWGKDAESIKINLEYREKEKVKGNEIDAMLVGASFFDKKKWLNLSEKAKDEVWCKLKDYLADEDMSEKEVGAFISKHGLSFKKADWADKLKEPVGTCNYSRSALERIVPLMEKGERLDIAIKEAGFIKKHKQQSLLPLPNRSNGFQITNPVVGAVMFQLRKVVNLLIKEIGIPDSIVVETTRQLKASKDARQKIQKKQTDNLRDKEKAKDVIREGMGWGSDVDVSNTDVMKWRLWEDQNHLCPYSCRKIPLSTLLSRDVEIDHILPYSMSLDNTMANKVVCFAAENQKKGQNTPVSWLGEGSRQWEKITEAKKAFKFSEKKWERFEVANDDIADKYTPERLLQDTSYIAREVCSFLKGLYPAESAEQKVRTTKGKITFELRNLWYLNAILRDGELGPKNRDDLRHHAVDAAVVAVTSHGMIQRITKVLQGNWPNRPKYAAIAEPWEGFGEDLADAVETINISHRVQRKVKGKLHEETNYGREENGLNKGKFITRKDLSGIKLPMVKKICDPQVRDLVLARMAEFVNDAKKAFEKPLFLPNKNGNPMPIRMVRIMKHASNMIQLKDSVWVEPGSNHHIEIVRLANGKQKGVVVSMFEAANRVKKGKSIVCQEHGKGEKFLYSLARNDMFLLEMDEGADSLHRIQKMVADGRVIFRPHTYGGRMKNTDSPPLIQRKSAGTLRGQKVTVDPLGRIRRSDWKGKQETCD